jgi:hypothetical protein
MRNNAKTLKNVEKFKKILPKISENLKKCLLVSSTESFTTLGNITFKDYVCSSKIQNLETFLHIITAISVFANIFLDNQRKDVS